MTESETTRATEAQLNELHRKLAERFLAMLSDPEKPVRGSTLKEIIAFLRDNNVKGAEKPQRPSALDVPFHEQGDS